MERSQKAQMTSPADFLPPLTFTMVILFEVMTAVDIIIFKAQFPYFLVFWYSSKNKDDTYYKMQKR